MASVLYGSVHISGKDGRIVWSTAQQLGEGGTDFAMLAARGMLEEMKQSFLLDPTDEGGPFKEGHDVNEKDPAGATAVHHAARAGHIKVLRFLCEHDGDLESASYGGLRPLHHAANMMREDCLIYLLVRGIRGSGAAPPSQRLAPACVGTQYHMHVFKWVVSSRFADPPA